MNEDEGIKKKFQRATKLKLLISHFMSSLKITFSCIVLFFFYLKITQQENTVFLLSVSKTELNFPKNSQFNFCLMFTCAYNQDFINTVLP